MFVYNILELKQLLVEQLRPTTPISSNTKRNMKILKDSKFLFNFKIVDTLLMKILKYFPFLTDLWVEIKEKEKNIKFFYGDWQFT